jgi:calcineurin-like phosphoesterase family protein
MANMNNWFTSDEHYGHSRIIEYCERPFDDIADMHAELIGRHNEVVADGDVVYHIGDFSLKLKLVQQVLPLLKGKHILVPGNHDECHPAHPTYAEKIRQYEDAGFEVMDPDGTSIILEIDETYEAIELHHFPFIAIDERYPECLPVDSGQWLLHGHIHNRSDGWTVRDRMINVGVDVWNYTPVSEEQIKQIIKGHRA